KQTLKRRGFLREVCAAFVERGELFERGRGVVFERGVAFEFARGFVCATELFVELCKLQIDFRLGRVLLLHGGEAVACFRCSVRHKRLRAEELDAREQRRRDERLSILRTCCFAFRGLRVWMDDRERDVAKQTGKREPAP